MLKPGTELNDGGTFRPVPPTKIQNCAWIKAHKTKITKVSSASFMVLVCKLKSCACNIHARQLTAAFMDQQHRRTLFHSTMQEVNTIRTSTRYLCYLWAWSLCWRGKMGLAVRKRQVRWLHLRKNHSNTKLKVWRGQKYGPSVGANSVQTLKGKGLYAVCTDGRTIFLTSPHLQLCVTMIFA